MNSRPTLGAAGALLALLASSASAAVLVDYKMTAFGDSLIGAVSAAPTTTAANVVATSLANQSGAGPVGSFNYNGGTDRVSSWSVATASSTNFANAFAAGSYITFSITAAAGHQIELSSISFQAASGSSNAASDRAFYLVAASSPAGFTAASTVLSTDRTVGGTLPLQDSGNVNNTVPRDYLVDLSSFGVIGAGETMHFRFYLQAGVSQSLTFDDIVVNGTVSPIPEPSAFAALAGLAGLGLAATRRRRRG